MWTELETKLVEWEKRFGELWLKKTQEYLDIDHKFIAAELPALKAEKHAAELRLRKMEELIAKTRVLLDDLNEDICRDLSRGHSLAAVGEALLEKFGAKLGKPYNEGRQIIRGFLEQHYNISKAASRDLFSLLEDVGTLFYQVDISNDIKDIPLTYYSLDEDMLPTAMDTGVYLELNGWWEIRA